MQKVSASADHQWQAVLSADGLEAEIRWRVGNDSRLLFADARRGSIMRIDNGMLSSNARLSEAERIVSEVKRAVTHTTIDAEMASLLGGLLHSNLTFDA